MRLALVSGHTFPAGGAAVTRILALAEAWVEAGHEVVVVLLNQQLVGGTPPGVRATNRWRWFSVARANPKMRGGWAVDVATRLGPALTRLHRTTPLDAVWVVDRVPWTLNVTRRACRRLQVPVLHELTEYLEITDAGPLRAALERRWLVTELRRLDGLLVISRALDTYARSIGVERVLLTGPMVHVGGSAAALAAPTPGPRVSLGYAGTVSQDKDGVLDLVTAVALLHADRPELPVTLTVLGSGPDEQAVRDRAEELGIADLVEVPGSLPPPELATALSGFRVLTLPRPDSHQARGGFPTKLGLYLVSGRPVVATRTGDVDCYLEDRVSAYLVPPGDPAAFAAALAAALDNPMEAEDIGRRGRDACEDGPFSAALRVRELTPFLREATESLHRTKRSRRQARTSGREA